MNDSSNPSKALIAYCVLADRLRKGGSLFNAITPFLAPICADHAGKLFDAQEFATGMSIRYGIKMPRLAALGLSEQLEVDGYLQRLSERPHVIYRYTNKATTVVVEEADKLTESQINVTVNKFVEFVGNDELVGKLDEPVLQQALYSRLLNVDSMRILSRAEAGASVKRTNETLQLPGSGSVSVEARRELHLDFLVSKYLLELQTSDSAAFERLSDVAFANMAAEAITCFVEPPDQARTLNTLTVYLDTPLILDILRVNEEYADYGTELLSLLKQAGVRVAALDHCISEAESVVAARLSHLRSGFNSLTVDWGVSSKPDLLAALKGQIAKHVSTRGINVERDPELLAQKRFEKALGSLQALITARMIAWKNTDAKSYDQRSILSLVCVRDTTTPARHLYDAHLLMLSRNTPLVSIANAGWIGWLTDTTTHSQSTIESWAPIAMTDKQFAGYLWMRSGGSAEKLPRARLMAHCSAAIRPRADIKARAYNLVLTTSGKDEADIFAALITDRDGERALMIATHGDPEDVTKERLPHIIHAVKVAAGDYAALVERKKADAEIAEIEKRAAEERDRIELLRAEAEKTAAVEIAAARNTATERESELLATRLQAAQEAQNKTNQIAALAEQLREKDNTERNRVHSIYEAAFRDGCRQYQAAKWLFALIYGVIAWALATWASGETSWYWSFLLFLVPFAGFWFVPDLLEIPARYLGRNKMLKTIRVRDPKLVVPAASADFKLRKWSALDKATDVLTLSS